MNRFKKDYILLLCITQNGSVRHLGAFVLKLPASSRNEARATRLVNSRLSNGTSLSRLRQFIRFHYSVIRLLETLIFKIDGALRIITSSRSDFSAWLCQYRFIFLSLTSLILYAVLYASITHTLCCYVFKETKLNPRMSTGRKNVSSSLGQKKERSEETQRWKALGQRSSPCYGQSIWKSPILGRRSCLSSGQTSTFLFSPKHPNLCDGCMCRVCTSCASICVWCWCTCSGIVHTYLLSPSACSCYAVYVCMILHICVFDRVCVFSDSKGLQKVGPSVWEQRGAVNECMKETQDNKPLE